MPSELLVQADHKTEIPHNAVYTFLRNLCSTAYLQLHKQTINLGVAQRPQRYTKHLIKLLSQARVLTQLEMNTCLMAFEVNKTLMVARDQL